MCSALGLPKLFLIVTSSGTRQDPDCLGLPMAHQSHVRPRRNGLRKLYDRLCLKVNEAKTAVASAFGRKFLSYSFWAALKGAVKRAVARKAKDTFKERIRQITCRSGGRSLSQVVDSLRQYMPGWKAYFQLAQTPGGVPCTRRVVRTPPPCAAAKALATRTNHVSGIASFGRVAGSRGAGGGKLLPLVAQQQNGCASRYAYRLL